MQVHFDMFLLGIHQIPDDKDQKIQIRCKKRNRDVLYGVGRRNLTILYFFYNVSAVDVVLTTLAKFISVRHESNEEKGYEEVVCVAHVGFAQQFGNC